MKKLFYIILVSFFLFGFSGIDQQKSFYFTPTKILKANGAATDEEPVTASNFLRSNSKEKQFLRWKVIEKTCPPQWHVYYCDNVSCYFMMPDSSNMHAVYQAQKEDANRMKIYVESNGAAGEGTVKIAVFEIKNRQNADTLTYNISIH